MHEFGDPLRVCQSPLVKQPLLLSLIAKYIYIYIQGGTEKSMGSLHDFTLYFRA